MAIGDPYATLNDIKNYLKIDLTDTSRDIPLTSALASASGDIEKHCQRQFNLAAGTSSRVYAPAAWNEVRTDDFATDTGLVIEIDSGGTGTFDQTVPGSDCELYPLNGISDGVPGWPYNRVRAAGGVSFPVPQLSYRRYATVRVTAQWGWPAVPAPIKQACLIIAAQKFRLADAPWGVAGMTEYGTAVRIREIPLVKETLVPYIRYPVLGG